MTKWLSSLTSILLLQLHVLGLLLFPSCLHLIHHQRHPTHHHLLLSGYTMMKCNQLVCSSLYSFMSYYLRLISRQSIHHRNSVSVIFSKGLLSLCIPVLNTKLYINNVDNVRFQSPYIQSSNSKSSAHAFSFLLVLDHTFLLPFFNQQ